MKITIDTTNQVLKQEGNGLVREVSLYTDEAFEILSRHWLRVGWNQKYSYTFTWLGRPVIQMPEDLIRIQEAIYSLRPDVIVETGVAHGGSLIFHSTICKAIGKGRVIGVDVEIRAQNRRAIESHILSSYVTLIEGSSTDPATVSKVHSLVKGGETVLVILDSCHTKEHVRRELEAYCNLVSPGSYMIVADGIMKDLHDVPRGKPDWRSDHPAAAAAEFCEQHPDFVSERPTWLFNESSLSHDVTYCPGGWLKRVSS